MDILSYNRKAWDHQVGRGNVWTQCVDRATIEAAKAGCFGIVLTPHKPVPRDWFPASLTAKQILCLASGGGQQGPVLAAAGGVVTVLDNSPEQLKQDAAVAKRDGLALTCELGDMRDLTRFEDASFDLVFHPVSNVFVDSVLPVFREAARVLKPGGALLCGLANPILFIFDLKAWNENRLVVRHRIPYSDERDLSPTEFQKLIVDQNEPVSFGHSLQDLIQGQIDAGLVIAGFYEDKSCDGPLDEFIDSYMATRAIKLK